MRLGAHMMRSTGNDKRRKASRRLGALLPEDIFFLALW
jgi:hypothetical protein